MIWVWLLLGVAVLASGAWIARAWVISERKRKRIAEARQRAFDFSDDPPPRPSSPERLQLVDRGIHIYARGRGRESETKAEPIPAPLGEGLDWPTPPERDTPVPGATGLFETRLVQVDPPSFEGHGGEFGGAGASGGWTNDVPADASSPDPVQSSD